MSQQVDRNIYLDHAATTAVDPRVVEAMLPYWTGRYGNPSSIYRVGREAHHAMDQARQTVADILGCSPNEVIFTSCGTESDNLALRGVAAARRAQGNQIITSSIEHHAVSNTCRQLQEQGYEVAMAVADEAGHSHAAVHELDPFVVNASLAPRSRQ